MITGIHGSEGIVVKGGQPHLPYLQPSSEPLTVDGRPCYNGDLRYMYGSYQMFNNGVWSTSASIYSQVMLSPDVEMVLNWARRKMEEELRFEELANKHPAIKDTKLQLDVLVALLKDNND